MALFTTALGLYGGVLWAVGGGAVSSKLQAPSSKDPCHVICDMGNL
jgi:hypothetical protein